MKDKKTLFIILFIMIAFFINAQEATTNPNESAAPKPETSPTTTPETSPTTTPETSQPTNAAQETKPTQTITKQEASTKSAVPEPTIEEIFRWGMDEQILSTLKTLSEKKESVPHDLLHQLYQKTFSQPVKAACLDYWREQKNSFLYDEVLSEWSELPTRDFILQASSLNYLFSFLPEKEDEKTLTILGDVLRYGDYKVKNELLTLIVKSKMNSFEPVMKELWEDSEGQLALQTALLRSMGGLKSEDSFQLLKDQLENDAISNDLRMAAAEGLGGYESAEAYEILMGQINVNNIYLRWKIYLALLSTKNPKLSQVIEEGSKDAYWQIRKSVLQFIGDQQLTEYAPLLLFKANNDPEKTIREFVIRQMGKIQTPQLQAYLQEYVRTEKHGLKQRQIAFDSLEIYQYSTQIPFMIDLWTRYKEKPLKTVAEHMAMKLSITKESGLDVMYELFFASEVGLFKMYAIRGIGLNGSSVCRNEIEELQKSDKETTLVKEARKLLSQKSDEEATSDTTSEATKEATSSTSKEATTEEKSATSETIQKIDEDLNSSNELPTESNPTEVQ